MKKSKAIFLCNECGYESPGWLGKCPNCGSWNSLVEFFAPSDKKTSSGSIRNSSGGRPTPLTQRDIDMSKETRKSTGLSEFDRSLGGGIVEGSLVLLSGDPGIGKSTLLLQASHYVAKNHGKVLYATGEESKEQIGMRAKRLDIDNEDLLVLAETDVDSICSYAIEMKPVLVVIDSIQTMSTDGANTSPGSISQVKESAAKLMNLAKGENIPVFLVGHVNKSGAIAGPKILEHMVDTVVYFEGERNYSHRILRTIKNRFGSTNELGIFEMTESGLTEVKNPSEALLRERPFKTSGSAIIASMEGTRPILVEIQALVVKSTYATPRRMTTGCDYNRTSIITAVLDKRVGIHLLTDDVYISVAGGINLTEPACDLGIATSIVSSFKGVPVKDRTVVFGEIGLAGEIRAVGRAEQRIAEAERLGFTRCVLPTWNLKEKSVFGKYKIELIGVDTVRAALDEVLEI